MGDMREIYMYGIDMCSSGMSASKRIYVTTPYYESMTLWRGGPCYHTSPSGEMCFVFPSRLTSSSRIGIEKVEEEDEEGCGVRRVTLAGKVMKCRRL